MKDWFFWKKRPAHDPCHGRPARHASSNVAAATIAVTIPLITAFEGPAPGLCDNKIATQFHAASEPLRADAERDVGLRRYGFRHFFFEVGYTRQEPPKPV